MADNFCVKIIQPGIAEYRVALYEGLREKFGKRISLCAGPRVYMGSSYRIQGIDCDYTCDFKKIGPFLWQKGLSLRGLGAGDVLVVGGDIHHVRSVLLAFLAKLRGIAVVWWGHHLTAMSSPWKAWVRVQIARLCSTVILCYTKEGIGWFVDHGIPKNRVFATGNTIDVDAIDAAREKWTNERLSEFKQMHGLMGLRCILFCSTLRPKTRLDLAIRAFSKVHERHPDVKLIVIGDGELKPSCQELATSLGVADSILWTGKILGQMNLAPWFLSSAVFVYPGAVGLSLLHAFGYGLPAVIHGCARNQMPEFEAARRDVNAVFFEEGNVDDMVRVLCELLCDEGKRKSMGLAARRTVKDEYSMSAMIENFTNAIMSAHDLVAIRDV